jgi:hypothetical protein
MHFRGHSGTAAAPPDTGVLSDIKGNTGEKYGPGYQRHLKRVALHDDGKHGYVDMEVMRQDDQKDEDRRNEKYPNRRSAEFHRFTQCYDDVSVVSRERDTSHPEAVHA